VLYNHDARRQFARHLCPGRPLFFSRNKPVQYRVTRFTRRYVPVAIIIWNNIENVPFLDESEKNVHTSTWYSFRDTSLVFFILVCENIYFSSIINHTDISSLQRRVRPRTNILAFIESYVSINMTHDSSISYFEIIIVLHVIYRKAKYKTTNH